MANKKKKKIPKIFSILLFLSTIIMIGLIIYADILPIKFLIPLITIILLIDGIGTLFLKFKRPKVKWYIMFLLLFNINCIAIFYLLSTLGFLNGFKSYDYKIEEYNIIVLNDSKYKKIDELKNIGYYDNKYEGTKKALKEIKKITSIKTNSIDDLDKLIISLNENNEAILLESSQYKMLCEEDLSLEGTTRILETISIKLKVAASKTKDINVLKTPFTVYISGSDDYGKITTVSRSDVNLIATIDVENKKVLVIDIPRDYYVTLPEKKSKDKLTHAGIYGINSSIDTLENLLDTKINYYLKVNFSSLEKVVDVLDGIDVESNYEFTAWDGTRFNKGHNHLNGKKALTFVRERHAFAKGDRVRGENQEIVLKAIVDKAISPKILVKYNDLLKSVEGQFVTNFDSKNITKIIKNQLKKNEPWTIETYNLSGTDSYEYTYSYTSKKLYVMVPDINSVDTAKQKIYEYIKEK